MTAYERSGWRDESLSRRHRRWGFNCPAVDLDFLMVEYNLGLAAALVEYKHHRAAMPDLRHPTYRALEDLANRCSHGCWGCTPLPFMLAFYWSEVWAFRVYPINARAVELYGDGPAELTEQEYVASLYQARSLVVHEQVLRNLNAVTVAEAERRGA